MTKRKGNGKRGGRGGGRGNGGGRGRGGGGGRGRGRGMSESHRLGEALDFNIQMYADANLETPPHGAGRGHTRRAEPNSETNHTPNRGRGRAFRGRGRGHPDIHIPHNRHSDYSIGASPNGRGRGGRPQRLGRDAPLTKLLYQDRPLLRPIVFVPSVLNPILFDKDDALLKPGVEEVGDTEQSHVPTAARVSRVFSGGHIPVVESNTEVDNDDANDDDKEELEVVDFNDIAKLFELTKKPKKVSPKKSNVVEKQSIRGFTDTNSLSPPASSLPQPQHSLTDVDTLTKMMVDNLPATEKYLADDAVPKSTHNGPASAEAIEPSLFYIDTQPTPTPAGIAPPYNPFSSDDFDDDIIVYVAPHPRKGVQTSPEKPPPSTNEVPDTSRFTPYVRDAAFSLAVASSSTSTTIPTEPQSRPQTQNPSMSSFSFSFPTPEGKLGNRLRVPTVMTRRSAKSWKRKRGVLTGKGTKPRSSFRTFGAMREEAQLHDPKQKERRRGDSDLDWGDTDGDGDDSECDHAVNGAESPSALVNGNGDRNVNVNGRDKGKGKAREIQDEHGMEVDSDLDLETAQQFVRSFFGENAGRHVTMDDLKDEEQMRKENEQDTGNDSPSVDESGSEESSEDDDAEVERVLAEEEAMLISETLEFEDDDDEENDSEDEDEDQTPRSSFQKRLERLRNQASSSKHDDEYDISDDFDDMMERNMTLAEKDDSHFGYSARLFFDVPDEADSEFERSNHTKSKKPRQFDLPEDFKIQWEKDRLKKADYRKARAQARLEASADPQSRKKGGKKGRKAMLAAARVDPTITVLPNRVIDMVTLVQQIKRFINDDDGPLTMSLPPANKATRKNVHDLATAFNLKSISKGKGDARYTTLTKTSRTGLFVDEAKVAKIVRKGGARGDSFVKDRKGKARNGDHTLVPRHREGDEVGKAAPKLSSNNLGFRMLAMMGWSEGERIGVSGGLQDPLTAIIKNTKLGLGAAK